MERPGLSGLYNVRNKLRKKREDSLLFWFTLSCQCYKCTNTYKMKDEEI